MGLGRAVSLGFTPGTARIPQLGKALFWLDGTISGSEFVDRSGNGRNFTITGKDWTGNYFPYKSAATISAPVGDTVLFDADVNSFLYGVDADHPNEIPVVSFFQNIDYENIGFSRHIAQVLDGNGVETTEPAVVDFVWYQAALTGTELAAAVTYYGVPTEQTTTVKWVSKDGNDTTGDGSKSNPWLTIAKAQTSATLGDLIYIKTGSYSEASALTATKSMTCLGFCPMQFTNATYSVLANTSDITLKGLFITGNGGTSYAFLVNTGKTGITIESCYEKSHGRQLAFVMGGGPTIKYCICTTDVVGAYGPIRTQIADITVDTCLFSGDCGYAVHGATATAGNVIIKNNKSTGTITDFYNQGVAATSVQFYGNYSSGAVSYGYHAGAVAGTVNVSYNTGSYVSGLILIEGTGGDVTVIGNNVSVAGIVNAINIESRNCTIYNNFIKKTTTGSPLLIKAASGSFTLDVHNNYFENSAAGGMVNIGSEGQATPDTLSGDFYNNHCKGSFAVNGTENGTHGIFVWQAGAVNVYDNFVEGCALSVVLKGNGTDYATGKVQSNVCKNGRIVVKGVINSNIIGNTIYIEDDPGGSGTVYGINLLAQDGGYDTTGTVIKNNVIIINDVGAYYCIYANDASQTFTSDYNTYYNVNADWFRITTTDYTFAEWQGLSNDVNGNDLNITEFAALFTDYSSDDFSSAAGSAAIGAGETLASDYDDGLDASTDWGDDSTLPVVVTKQQTAPWDVGACVS